MERHDQRAHIEGYAISPCRCARNTFGKKKKGTPDIWEEFSELLFKQPEFMGLEGSVHSIQEQYRVTLRARSQHHGWTDANGGITGNLSGHEGQLDELDRMAKQILMDKESKKAEKELKKILKRS